MNEQRTLALAAELEKHEKRTRRAEFASQMEIAVPWRELIAEIGPFYPKAGDGLPPAGLKRKGGVVDSFASSNPTIEAADEWSINGQIARSQKSLKAGHRAVRGCSLAPSR